jgi:hypothetical protein
MTDNEITLIKEITKVTLQIRSEYPEVYAKLEEMPITVPNSTAGSVRIKDLQDYLDSLNQIKKEFDSNRNIETE